MFAMSKHAIERALEMGLDGSEIRAAMDDPDVIYWSDRYQGFNYARGRVCLATQDVDDGKKLVVTVLWTSDRDWRIDAARAPLPPDRYLPGRA